MHREYVNHILNKEPLKGLIKNIGFPRNDKSFT